MLYEIEVLLENPELVQTLGKLLFVAILLGAVLDRGGKDLLSWGVAILLFAGFIVFGAPQAMQRPETVRPVAAFVVLNTTVYLAGLSLGWCAAVGFRKLYWRRVFKIKAREKPDDRAHYL